MAVTGSFRDLLATVLAHAQSGPDRPCVQTFSRRTKAEGRTFGEVAEAAARAAAFLHEHGLKRGDVVVLLGTHHIDFYAAWLGCVWLGAIPTVLAEPTVRVAKDIYWSRLRELLSRVEAWGLALDPRVKLDEQIPLPGHAYRYDQIAAGAGPAPPRVVPQAEETLLLQHSSGTTGLQKGVMLSHQAIWRHAQSYHRHLGFRDSDVVASWLPLYHDMGFVACFIGSLLQGTPVIWLSPFEWVANPALLLDAVSEHRATLAWLPNFAFAFLTQRVKAERGKYDLSSLRALVNCSEPVLAEAMRAFASRFAADGFAPGALQACYAMAENVFAVSSSNGESPPRFRTLDRRIWTAEHRAVPVAAETPDALVHVSNGPCVEGCEAKIVDADGKILPALTAGQVLIRSPFLFTGYFRRDDLNSKLFDAEGFFHTRDVGYLDEAGHVYITGRQNDLIISGGKNIYPQDIEQVAGEVPGVYPGRIVCFGVSLHDLGTEGLVVLFESEEPQETWAEVERQVRISVPARLDLDVFDTRIVPRGTLRKSTSGKLARDGNRQWYLAGKFGSISQDITPEN